MSNIFLDFNLLIHIFQFNFTLYNFLVQISIKQVQLNTITIMSFFCCQSLRNLFSKQPNIAQQNQKPSPKPQPKKTITKNNKQLVQHISTDHLQEPEPSRKNKQQANLKQLWPVLYYTMRDQPKIQIDKLEQFKDEAHPQKKKLKKINLQGDINIQLIRTSRQQKTYNLKRPNKKEEIIPSLGNYQTTKQTNQIKKQQCQLTLQLINNTSININFQSNKTIKDLKKFICRKYQKQFQYQQIVIRQRQTNLNSKAPLKDIFKNNKASLTVKKADLCQIQALTTVKDGIDEINEEKGVVEARCGHRISRGHMDYLVRYQINTLKNNQIYCPHLNSDGSACGGKFQLQFCRLVAGFTNEDMKILGDLLSQNWIKKYAISCPQCTFPTSKQNLNTKRMFCQACGFGPYCTDCRQKCTGGQTALCRSVLCEYLRANVVNAPWTRVFMMYNYPDTDKTFPVKVPNVRLCPQPNCRQLVYNTGDCKHTKCTCTPAGYSFCYVCLSLAPQKGEQWSCKKGGFQYCGFVAPNQVYAEPENAIQNIGSNRSLN